MNESTACSPSLLGLDLAGQVSLHLNRRGFSLAVLPRWFLALEAGVTGKGMSASGRVFGRGFFLEIPGNLLDRGEGAMGCMKEERSRTFWLGRACLLVDRKD